MDGAKFLRRLEVEVSSAHSELVAITILKDLVLLFSVGPFQGKGADERSLAGRNCTPVFMGRRNTRCMCAQCANDPR